MQVIQLLPSAQLKSFTSWCLFQSARLSWSEKTGRVRRPLLSARGHGPPQGTEWPSAKSGPLVSLGPLHLNKSLHCIHWSPSPTESLGRNFLDSFHGLEPSPFSFLCSTQLANSRQQNENKNLSIELHSNAEFAWEPHVNKGPSWLPLNTPNRLKQFFFFYCVSEQLLARVYLKICWVTEEQAGISQEARTIP